MRRSINWPRFSVELEGTPVAIALIAVLGICVVAFSPMTPENKRLAIMALAQLAGGAAGVAMPRGNRSFNDAPMRNLGNSPASNPPEWGGRD